MGKSIVNFLLRVLVLFIIGFASYILAISLGIGDDAALTMTLDVFFGAAIVMIVGIAVKHFAEMKKTGRFFGVIRPRAGTGIASYVISRIVWCSLFGLFISISHVDKTSSGDYPAFVYLLFTLFFFGTLIAVPTGLAFFSQMRKLRLNDPAGSAFTANYGEGRRTNPVFDITGITVSDGRYREIKQIVTGFSGDSFPLQPDPVNDLIASRAALPAYFITSGSLEELISQTGGMFIRTVNDLLERKGCSYRIAYEEWYGILRENADRFLFARMSAALDLSYYVFSCTDRLLFPHGYTIAELTDMRDPNLPRAAAVVVSTSEAEALNRIITG